MCIQGTKGENTGPFTGEKKKLTKGKGGSREHRTKKQKARREKTAQGRSYESKNSGILQLPRDRGELHAGRPVWGKSDIGS